MRIAIVTLMGGATWGGSESLWHRLAMHTLQQGNQVFVSVYDWGKLHPKIEQLQQSGATVYFRRQYNPQAGTLARIIRFIRHRLPSMNKDYQSIIDFKPDTVFISQGGSFDLAIHHRPLYELLKSNGISYSMVCHSHSQFSYIPEQAIFPGAIEIFKSAKRVFFVSHRQWELTERRLAMKISNGQFTWNPINMEMPGQALSWPSNIRVQFAIVGSLDGSKGQDTAIEILAGASWADRDWQLNIYGQGLGLSYLQRLAVYFGISDRVVFHGHVSDIQSIWKVNHALLIPSAGEGLPISMVEAMACGRPAIVTDVGGNTELVIEDETGFIAASPNSSSFIIAMEKAWRQKELWKDLGNNAYELINDRLEKLPEEKIFEVLRNQEK